jgi:hypothetical protein
MGFVTSSEKPIRLDEANTWTAAQTFSVAPFIPTLTQGGFITAGLTGQLINMTGLAWSSSARTFSINMNASQTQNIFQIRNSSSVAQLYIDKDLRFVSASDAFVFSSDTSVTDMTFTIQRNSSSGAFNGTILELKDNSVSAYIKWLNNSFVQNSCDLEFHAAGGKMLTMPYTGGIYFYNPFQNTPDISVCRIPAQTLYPGGGTWQIQSIFNVSASTISTTGGAITVVNAASFYVEGGPITGTGAITVTNSYAFLLGGGLAGFNGDLNLLGTTSTTDNRKQACFTHEWVVSTDASRTGRFKLCSSDASSDREVLRGESDGSDPMIGFLGASAITRPDVTGSAGGNAALISLLTALEDLGLITDSST